MCNPSAQLNTTSHPLSLRLVPRIFHLLVAILFLLQGLLGITFAIWLVVYDRLNPVSIVFFCFSIPPVFMGMLAIRVSKDFKSRKTNWAFFMFAIITGMLTVFAAGTSAIFFERGNTLLLWIWVGGSLEVFLITLDLIVLAVPRNWNWLFVAQRNLKEPSTIPN